MWITNNFYSNHLPCMSLICGRIFLRELLSQADRKKPREQERRFIRAGLHFRKSAMMEGAFLNKIKENFGER